nr:MFS transporter [Nocardia bovistercoris]
MVVAVGVFTVTATEMMPIGLLPDIAADLGVSEGAAGLGVTLFGVLAGFLAPPATMLSGRVDRRTLLLVISTVFTVGNAACGLSPNYLMYMVSRFGTGVIHGLMWSIVASIAIRLVHERDSVRATSVVFSGISLALVLGVPFGSVLGAVFGWRWAFLALAVLSAACLPLVRLLLPRLPATGQLSPAQFRPLLRSKTLLTACTLTAIIVIGNYAAYTYIAPFLNTERGVDLTLIGPFLLAYGIAGVVGNFLSGAVITRTGSVRGVLVVFTVVLALALTCLLVTNWIPLVAVVLIVWGVAYSGLPVALQTLVLATGPDGGEAATSLYVLVFNCSIAAGALFGALGIDTGGASTPILLGAVFSTLAVAVAMSMKTVALNPATEPVAHR